VKVVLISLKERKKELKRKEKKNRRSIRKLSARRGGK